MILQTSALRFVLKKLSTTHDRSQVFAYLVRRHQSLVRFSS